jgi:hypothetical protein
MRLKVQLATSPIGYVGVELRRREIGVAEHLLDGAQIGAAFEQVRREGVPQEVRMDAFGFETCLPGEAAEDQEDARAGQRAAAGVEKQLGPPPCVEERPAP